MKSYGSFDHLEIGAEAECDQGETASDTLEHLIDWTDMKITKELNVDFNARVTKSRDEGHKIMDELDAQIIAKRKELQVIAHLLEEWASSRPTEEKKAEGN